MKFGDPSYIGFSRYHAGK